MRRQAMVATTKAMATAMQVRRPRNLKSHPLCIQAVVGLTQGGPDAWQGSRVVAASGCTG